MDANRTILCCESIDWDEEIEGRVPDLVRGTLQIAGYDLQRREDGDVFLSFCVQVNLSMHLNFIYFIQAFILQVVTYSFRRFFYILFSFC